MAMGLHPDGTPMKFFEAVGGSTSRRRRGRISLGSASAGTVRS